MFGMHVSIVFREGLLIARDSEGTRVLCTVVTYVPFLKGQGFKSISCLFSSKVSANQFCYGGW